MSVEELVKRLREPWPEYDYRDEAADKLEELAAALRIAQGNTDAAIEDYNEAQAALAEARRENEALREAMNRIEMWATDKSEKAWYRLEIIAYEALNAGGKNAR